MLPIGLNEEHYLIFQRQQAVVHEHGEKCYHCVLYQGAYATSVAAEWRAATAYCKLTFCDVLEVLSVVIYEQSSRTRTCSTYMWAPAVDRMGTSSDKGISVSILYLGKPGEELGHVFVVWGFIRARARYYEVLRLGKMLTSRNHEVPTRTSSPLPLIEAWSSNSFKLR